VDGVVTPGRGREVLKHGAVLVSPPGRSRGSGF
jgi:hypothetical protein